jgi:hypothetical protein
VIGTASVSLLAAGLLCVRPLEGVVELFTVIAGEIATSDTMVANGGQRLRSLEGCEGWESSEFSDDGLRLFTHSDFVCGEEIPRWSTGVMSMISPTMWVDVRSVEGGGEPVAWVQRYSLVGPLRMTGAGVEDVTQSRALAVESARLSAPGQIELAEVREAAEKIDAKAVEAWIAARGRGFKLHADGLTALIQAGVAESIVDVLVAVTYPAYFSIDTYDVVRRRRDLRAAQYASSARPLFWEPVYYGDYEPATVPVGPGPPGTRGRVVNGEGYSQDTSSGSPDSGGPAGDSSGSSGGSRTAKPRGGETPFA